MESKSFSSSLNIILFILGLIFVDRAIKFIGNYLANSPYWYNTTLTKLSDIEKLDILIIGDCRAAVEIDSKILSKKLNKNVFNAGKTEEGLGMMDFTLNVALSKHSPKIVLVQIDEIILQQTYDEANLEVKKRIPWVSLLSEKRYDYINSQYDVNDILNYSGFWIYKGQGENIFSSLYLLIRNQSRSEVDGYLPFPSRNNTSQALLNSRLEKSVITPSSFAVRKISSMVEEIKRNGGIPILIVTPMFFNNNTDGLSEEKIVAEISKKFNIPYLFYNDDKSYISNTKKFWKDSSHLNRLGAENFSSSLADDLNKLNLF